MPIKTKHGQTVITGKNSVMLFHMLAQRSALKLEILGLRHSRGSVYAHIKRTYGLRGNKQKVLEQFEKLIAEKYPTVESAQ